MHIYFLMWHLLHVPLKANICLSFYTHFNSHYRLLDSFPLILHLSRILSMLRHEALLNVSFDDTALDCLYFASLILEFVVALLCLKSIFLNKMFVTYAVERHDKYGALRFISVESHNLRFDAFTLLEISSIGYK